MSTSMERYPIFSGDVGYGQVKVLTSTDKKFQFPSIYANVDDSSLDLTSQPLDIVIEKENEDPQEFRILYGEQALGSGELTSVDTHRLTSEAGIVLMAAALWESELTGSIILTTGTPVAYFANEAKIARTFWNGRTVRLAKGSRRRTIHIVSAYLHPQGISALVSAGGIPDFQAKMPKKGYFAALIDIGQKTSDIAVVSSQFEIISQMSMSSTFGMFDVIAKIQRKIAPYVIQRGITASDIPDGMIEDFLNSKDGKISIFGQEVDFSLARHNIFKESAQKIEGDIKKSWQKNAFNVTSLFVAGGGAPYLAGFFKFDQVTVLKTRELEPQFANVKGYLQLTTKKLQLQAAGL